MVSIIKWLMALLLVSACIFSLPSFGQEESDYMYLEPKGEGEDDQGINTGWVVAYGKRIPPPYYVKFERDTIWINDLPYSPTWKEPTKEPVKVVASELARQKHNLNESIFRSYRKYADSLGIQTAREMIQTEYGGHPLIKSMTFSDVSETMQLEWADGQVEHVFLYDLGPGITMEEWRTQRQQAAERVRDSLRHGWMIIFSYCVPMHYRPPEKAQEIQSIILDAKAGVISLEDAKSMLSQTLRQHHVEQILSNLDSWE
jgi:hypothetical protein